MSANASLFHACCIRDERYRDKRKKFLFLSPFDGPWKEGPLPPRGGVLLESFVYSL